ncbi:hypothetical protein N0V90_010304 [Kalmusia sp. IMI 367209]|nr:hypothetical protein N0V90_010304 [Kalmusia sp. IMI 367209]
METPALAISRDDRRKRNETSLSHFIPHKPFQETIGKHVDETRFLEIGKRLRIRETYLEKSFSKHWSNNVRLFTLLRMLGYHDGDQVFKKFEREEIGDFWLPLTDNVLEKFTSIVAFDLDAFLEGQLYVLSDSKLMDDQNLLAPFFKRQYKPGPRARTHRYLEYVDSHFTDLDHIAKGGSAQVLRVQHTLSSKEFACKRISRKVPVAFQRNRLKLFEQEVKVLERIRHDHIVGLVASFTDLENFSLILDPIADGVLLGLLEVQPLSGEDIATLLCSFNCLATALEFLHTNSVRHKDIKPSNILLSNGRILLCDFGISLEWTESENGTTEGVHLSGTRRYAAPEVFRSDASRNSKTDIWSLGCVFMEIISAIKGFQTEKIDVGESEEGGLSSKEMAEWLGILKDEQHDGAINNLPIYWTLAMTILKSV